MHVLIVGLLAAAPGVVNGGFETGDVPSADAGRLADGGVADGVWRTVRGTESQYSVRFTNERPASGKRAVELESRDRRGSEQPGILSQAIAAEPYRGQRVRLTAKLRTSQPESAAMAWLRVDRPDETGFFDNMWERPLRGDRWQTATIVGDVAPDATRVVFGAMVTGPGKMTVDDVVLELLGPTPPTAEPEGPRPLDEAELDTLRAFAQAFGLLVAFHPSDQALAADRVELAIAGVRKVGHAKTPEERAEALSAALGSIAPTAQFFVTGKAPAAKGIPQGPRLRFWHHQGYCPGTCSAYASHPVEAALAKRPDGAPDPSVPVDTVLAGGVTLRATQAVYVDAKGSLPHLVAAPVGLKPTVAQADFSDRATRLAAVATWWSLLELFYPYFEVTTGDWPAALGEALRRAAIDDAKTFETTVNRLVAALQDGHGTVASSTTTWASPAFQLRWLDGELVVTDVFDAKAGLAPGDVIVRVDGRGVVEQREALLASAAGATEAYREFRASRALFSGRAGSTVEVVAQAPGKPPRALKLTRVDTEKHLDRRQLTEVAPGVLYVDLRTLTDAEWTKALPALERAKGLVFDMRGYPTGTATTVLRHLTTERLQSAHFEVGEQLKPGHLTWVDNRWDLAPLAPRLAAPAVFLTDAEAISYAESIMGIVEAYHLGTVVGEPTAGTNGNINVIAFGDMRVIFTGMKVIKHNGSRHHGLGIVPTVAARPTRAGLAAGRDEVLEAGLRTLRKGAGTAEK